MYLLGRRRCNVLFFSYFLFAYDLRFIISSSFPPEKIVSVFGVRGRGGRGKEEDREKKPSQRTRKLRSSSRNSFIKYIGIRIYSTLHSFVRFHHRGSIILVLIPVYHAFLWLIYSTATACIFLLSYVYVLATYTAVRL